jgi:cytochrome c oxidase subunit 2
MVVLMRVLIFLPALVSLVAGQAKDARPDKVISITAERFSFSPARIKLKQGMLVEFVVTSEDTDHGLRIPAAGIEAAIPQQGKGELKIRFVAKEKGEFPFECSRPCGAGHNLMRGVIVVE